MLLNYCKIFYILAAELAQFIRRQLNTRLAADPSANFFSHPLVWNAHHLGHVIYFFKKRNELVIGKLDIVKQILFKDV